MSSIITNPVVFRSNIKKNLEKKINHSIDDSLIQKNKLATNLEKAIFNYAIK